MSEPAPQVPTVTSDVTTSDVASSEAQVASSETTPQGPKKPRRRGSRGGNRNRTTGQSSSVERTASDSSESAVVAKAADRRPEELPERLSENRPSVEAADRALVRKPQIGDSMPAPPMPPSPAPVASPAAEVSKPTPQQRPAQTRSAQTRSAEQRPAESEPPKKVESSSTTETVDSEGAPVQEAQASPKPAGSSNAARRRKRGVRGPAKSGENTNRSSASGVDGSSDLDEQEKSRRRGRERKGRPVGRYLMCAQVRDGVTQIAVLEGRALLEHYVSRVTDDDSQIHGNIYLGRVQNVLPGMEAAFIDIGTPKNAVLYRGDVQYDAEDIEEGAGPARIESILKARQAIVCQVTKNPIGAKGARLTQEVSLPGRFVVLIPNSSTYGISKRLADDERKRLRNILDKVKPANHGLIVRTAAEGATREELERDVVRLLGQWEKIEEMAKASVAPTLLYQEPGMAVRVIREEFNVTYRGVVIDDPALFEEVQGYVTSISPELADRVQLYDRAAEPLPLFELHHVHEQLHKALDRKVWLASGGSLIIERTEALTVIDVNTGKNVGKSNLEETVFRNNLEAAEEVARQLRLRDIGGIIVIDFIDMEISRNRDEVIRTFRDALARDKTRTQVFDISELGLVEMTRKRIGEGLIESMSGPCVECDGRGLVFDKALLG